MNALALWLLIGVVATCLEVWGALRQQPEVLRQYAEASPGGVAVLLTVFVLGGPLTLAGSLASAFPRRE